MTAINGFNTDCSALTASFKYDALNRRIEKTINGLTTKYIYDGLDIIQELNQDGTVKANYIRGLNIDEPLARIKADGTVRYYQTDALGSVIALADNTGAVKTTYSYDPFGNVTISGEASDNPFQYTGRENDETGLYYYRARYYSPELQRFISEDPIGLKGGINKYSYVGNNPVNFVDPLGLICTYSQSSGLMLCTDDKTSKVYYVGLGYSGARSGYGYNNPEMQGEKGVGPITRGQWQMEGNWYKHPDLGKNTMKLVPLAGNECYDTNRDCDTFRMHGDNTIKDASKGCIVLPPDRTKIKRGEIIEVVW